jgi:hypothetical protein
MIVIKIAMTIALMFSALNNRFPGTNYQFYVDRIEDNNMAVIEIYNEQTDNIQFVDYSLDNNCFMD